MRNVSMPRQKFEKKKLLIHELNINVTLSKSKYTNSTKLAEMKQMHPMKTENKDINCKQSLIIQTTMSKVAVLSE